MKLLWVKTKLFWKDLRIGYLEFKRQRIETKIAIMRGTK